MRSRYLFLVVMSVIQLGGFACREGSTETRPPTLSLVLQDVGSTEVFLRCTAGFSSPNAKIVLRRNGVLIGTFTQPVIDTVIRDVSLMPRGAYSYVAYRELNFVKVDSSEWLTVTTLDTTRHSMEWRVDTLGDGGSSTLYDVAICNDSLVVAVGELYFKDSVGVFMRAMGAARWDGLHWSASRLFSANPLGYYSLLTPRGIQSSSQNDFWLAQGGVFHWDGISDTLEPYWINASSGNPDAIWRTGQGARRIWLASGTSIFAAGTEGAIAHFNGSVWSNVENLSALEIQDIWGEVDPLGRASNVTLSSYDAFGTGESGLIRINSSGRAEVLPWPSDPKAFSVWFKSAYKMYVGGGNGVMVGNPSAVDVVGGLPNYAPFRIRGTGLNDIFVVGSFGLFAHYNGLSWETYPELAIPNGSYYGLAVSSGLVVAVGFVGDRAVVVRGYRTQL